MLHSSLEISNMRLICLVRAADWWKLLLRLELAWEVCGFLLSLELGSVVVQQLLKLMVSPLLNLVGDISR